MKTCLYNFDPHKPHFYIVKLGFTGVYIIFLISAQKHRLWYLLEPPRRGGSSEYLQCIEQKSEKKYHNFLSENFHILLVKISVYLNRHVFVMNPADTRMLFLNGKDNFYMNLYKAKSENKEETK